MPLCVSMCQVHVWYPQRPPEGIVSHHVCARNQIWVSSKSSCTLLTIPGDGAFNSTELLLALPCLLRFFFTKPLLIYLAGLNLLFPLLELPLCFSDHKFCIF